MKPWLALDADLRTALAALGGLVLGAIINWAVASLAYDATHFSPWSRKHPRDGLSPWLDRVPLYGWFRLRRKATQLGRGFWIRPLVVEAAMSAACAALYWWEVVEGGLLPIVVPPEVRTDPIFAYPLHYEYFAHVLLLTFMLAASLIDVDEMNIPDSITVPGTLAGLAFVTLLPWALLPIGVHPQFGVGVLRATFGMDPEVGWSPEVLERGFPNAASLGLAAFCYLLWCGGLLYRPWRTSRGYGTAVRLLVRRMRQDSATPWICLLAAIGVVLIGAVWYYDRVCWLGLTSSLVGLAVGGAIVWVTRVVGTWALGREAMGFGDVTLMAMIGAMVGWQAAVLIFFAAPAAALVLGGIQWLTTRSNVLPYGPFLCLSTAVIVVAWRPVWQAAMSRFAVPGLVPIVLVVGFVLLGLILALLRMVRSRG